MPQVAPKEERRVLRHASDGLRGETRRSASPERLGPQVPQIAANEEGIGLRAMPDE